MTDLGSKNPLQLAHSGYQDTKIFGTKVWGGSLDFNLQFDTLKFTFSQKSWTYERTSGLTDHWTDRLVTRRLELRNAAKN